MVSPYQHDCIHGLLPETLVYGSGECAIRMGDTDMSRSNVGARVSPVSVELYSRQARCRTKVEHFTLRHPTKHVQSYLLKTIPTLLPCSNTSSIFIHTSRYLVYWLDIRSSHGQSHSLPCSVLSSSLIITYFRTFRNEYASLCVCSATRICACARCQHYSRSRHSHIRPNTHGPYYRNRRRYSGTGAGHSQHYCLRVWYVSAQQ